MSRPARRRFTALVLALLTGLGLVAAQAPANAAAFVITTSTTSVSIDLGQSFTIKGDVSPSWYKQTVYLQVMQNGTWSNLAQTSTTNSAGSYSITYKPQSMGVRQYRMYRPPAGGVSAGTSKTITAKIHVWRDMYNWAPVHVTYNWKHVQSYTVGGVTYPKSFLADSDAWGRYNLKGQCSHVRSTFLVKDGDNDPQGQASGTWTSYRTADGKVLFTSTLFAGQKEFVKISTAGMYYVQFNWDLPTGSYRDQGSMGRPQARCTF